MRPGTHGLRGLFIALVASAIACGRQGPAAPVQVRTPNPDVGVDALAARQKAQREAVNGSQVPHDFQFSDKLEASGITFVHRIVEDAGKHYKAVHYDHGTGVAVADVDGDGRYDLYFVNQVGGSELWKNAGGGRFQNITREAGVALADRIGVAASFADTDNDGDEDLFVTTVRGGNALFENDGKGRFKDISKLVGPAIQLPQVSRGLAMGDLFNDGRVDIVIENLTGGPMILRPQGGPSNHWISFELAGTKGNRLALNARIRVTAGGLVQMDEIRSGGSYLSQNDLRIHLGLGGMDHVDRVEILWPTGNTEILTDLAADHFYDVKEGEGIVPVERSRPEEPPMPTTKLSSTRNREE